VTTAIQRCHLDLAQQSKSFYLASRLLPPKQRDHAAAVYAWCRRADDAIDLTERAKQPRALQALRSELDDVYDGVAMTDPVLAAFQWATSSSQIPKRFATEMLDGMQLDVIGCRFGSWDELLEYCYCVASTVGLMMCHVMGVSSARALPHAIDLGIAMQLTNIARDVREDWLRGRCYLPDRTLREHRAFAWLTESGGDVSSTQREQCRPVVQTIVQTAERYYRSGDRGLVYLPPRSAFAVASARFIYSAIGSRIAASGYDVLAPRAVVSFERKLWMVAKASWSVVKCRLYRDGRSSDAEVGRPGLTPRAGLLGLEEPDHPHGTAGHTLRS
jgi:15-cis-phytoene synthase